MSDTTSRSSTPLRINSPESYESAALEIDQEKQMVKALKRLSMGNMIDHDPDFPMEDPELLLMNERERNDDSTASLDTLSLSRSASPVSSESQSPPLEGKEPSLSPSKVSSGPTSHYVTPEDSIDSDTLSVNHDNVLWVPANMHPEVNPQQFKQHVKVTIDELLERKISRSKSTRSKRSSLSLSTNDDSHNDDDEEDTSIDNLSQHQDLTNRYSNPSLLELSTELESLSRLAGMDSDDAVTLARSLSTHSLGYTEVEKAAIDELGSPKAHTGANQAEILDFGMDKSPTKAFPGQQTSRGPHQQHPPSHQRYQNSPQASPLRRPQQRFAGDQRSSTEESQFALKRSRRMNYRKPHTSTPTHLGSQLQNKKAGNLAELRHNLNSSAMPMSYPSEPERHMKSPASRQSMQSINPRSSQVLFNYKGPARLLSHPKLPASAPPNSTPPPAVPAPRRSQGPGMGSSVKDSPFGPVASSPELHHNFGPRSLSAQNLMHQRHKHGLSSRPLRENLQQGFQGSSGFPSPHSPSGQFRPQHRKPSPTSHPRYEHGQPSAERRNFSPQGHPQYQNQSGPNLEYKQQYPQTHGYSQQQAHKHWQAANRSGMPPRSRRPLADPVKEEHQRISTPHHPARLGRDIKLEKTSQLNENLDMLRNEINEFKESLSQPERKRERVKEPEASQPQETSAVQPDELVPEISFDTSSADVSYEDTLGMEKDFLGQIKDEVRTSTPIASPEKQTKRSSMGTAPIEREKDATQNVRDTESSSAVNLPKNDDEITKFEVRTIEEPSPKLEQEEVVQRPVEPVKEDVEEPIREYVQPSQEEPSQEVKVERKESVSKSAEAIAKQLEIKDDDVSSRQTFENNRSSESLPRVKTRTSEPDESLKRTEVSPTMPVVDELKKLKKKKSFGSLTGGDKKKTKKSWIWSKGRSVSAQNLPEVANLQKPSRSVSSPDINTHKRDHKAASDHKEPKENVISKLFKKKRSNSVESPEVYAQRHETTNEEKEQKTIKRISSAIFGNSKDDDARSVSSKEEKEPSIDEVRLEILKEESIESSKSTLMSKMKAKVKHEEKEKSAAETVEVEETIEEASEEDLEEQKPQTTLEVQEKIKKLIKRTSKANQPLEYTDSAFGFPLPPPSVSTLVMLDYRFPVHVERAIYRLSHLKLANRKRSLREQVLLSNFMYAYLNLVDHTLHLEQRMSEEESNAMEEPDADMDLFNDDDKDTDFEGEDEALDDNAFDTVRLDLRGDSYNEITV